MNTLIRLVTPADLDHCYAIETVAYIKPSASDHGGMAWHEMVLTL